MWDTGHGTHDITIVCHHQRVCPTFKKYTSLPLPKCACNVALLEHAWHLSWIKYIWIDLLQVCGITAFQVFNHPDFCLSWPHLLLITLICSSLLSLLQFSSVAQSCPTLCNHMGCSTPGFPVHHQLPELAQTHVHRVGDAIQPSHLLLAPSPPAFNLSQHRGLFQWVSSSHQGATELDFQLQHQSFQ